MSERGGGVKCNPEPESLGRIAIARVRPPTDHPDNRDDTPSFSIPATDPHVLEVVRFKMDRVRAEIRRAHAAPVLQGVLRRELDSLQSSLETLSKWRGEWLRRGRT